MIMINPSRSIIRYCIPDASLTAEQLNVLYSDIYAYINSVFLITPWYIALPISVIQILFDVTVFLRHFRSFGNLTIAQQQKFVIYWCGLGRPFEGLIRLYRSLVLLKYFESNTAREQA